MILCMIMMGQISACQVFLVQQSKFAKAGTKL